MLAIHPGKFLSGQCMFLSFTVPDDIFKYWVHLRSFCFLQTEKAEELEGQQPNYLAGRLWLLATNTSALFEAIVCSFLHVATCFKSHFSLIAFFPLHTHWYIRLPSLPTLPSTLLSEWPARALWSARCSRWKAGAARCHPSAAPWLRLSSHVVSESGRSPWIVAGLPCKLGRTNRAGGPWAEQHPRYSARAPTGEPCGREWTRTWIQTEET